ncbi:MAG: EAL domain-containing protein [Oscillospiraceae bacterium]|nr:EAL domain-containing protein [Oscillospiraceae bacterium]
MNQNMFKDIHPDDTARFTNALLRFGVGGGRLELLYRTKKRDTAGYKVIHLLGEHVDTDDGLRLAQIWFTEEGDYQEESGTDLQRGVQKELQEESFKNSARYDYLTGLPNMSSFFELAEIGRKTILDQGGLPALLYFDLGGMKSYNHKYGFSEGDMLLRHFAGLLSRTFGTERCSHINADHFAAFADENGLEDRLGRLFREWRAMENNKHLPICVGVYPNRIEAVPVGMAYDRAKIACDAIKGTYASSFNYYSHALSEGIVRQQYILETFERALSENWIQVYYQPIVRAIDGKVCNEEALARWIDPVKGFLSPAEFIPYLEDAGLIYKLDLYILDQVLRYIKIKEAEGFYIVPHSINLSRSDFDACDMVEEIRRRVDAAGVSRDRINIEITESVIGSDFDYMKTQVERFQAFGFPVWMDDFGSGYSALDMLQSIKFDLIKFDMGFMRRLDDNDDGRIILTELMKMASALGVDTICEGVETEEQMRFLQEIGCSRLQGFYFSKPVPILHVLKYHRAHRLTGYENPEESEYYESLCSLNLYDVGVVAREEKTSLRNTYNTLPMCIIEVKGDSTRFVRTNQSYRDFFMRFFHLDPSALGPAFAKYDAAFMHNVVKACCEKGIRTFYDEKMPDGSIVHSFARRVDVNPVNGVTAIAIAVLSIREPNEKLMTEQILTVIEQFGEYMPGGFFIYRADDGRLLYANKAVFEVFGCDSLEEFKALTGFTFRGMVHPDDYERISTSIKDQIKDSQSDLDFVEYRIIRKDGAVRWLDDYGHYIEYDDQNSLYYVFISDITDKYEQAESDKAQRAAVIEALTRAYDSVWLINDVETQKFELFRIDKEMEHLIPADVAVKIEKFSQAFAFYSKLVLEEDRQRFLEALTPECLVRNTENMPIYSVPFRRVFDDGIRNYRVEFAKLDLPGGKTGIVCGFKNVDKQQ